MLAWEERTISTRRGPSQTRKTTMPNQILVEGFVVVFALERRLLARRCRPDISPLLCLFDRVLEVCEWVCSKPGCQMACTAHRIKNVTEEHRTKPFASRRGCLVQHREIVVKVGAAVWTPR